MGVSESDSKRYVTRRIMKINKITIALASLSLMLATACSQDHDLGSAMSEAQLIKSVSLSTGNTVKLAVGMTKQVITTITPTDAANPNLVWTSYNPEIATVENNGTIHGISQGQATLTVRQEGNLGALETVIVTVKPMVESLRLDPVSIYEGTSVVASAVLTPANAYDVFSWEIQDASIATMKGDTIVGLKPGETTIKLTTTDGSNLTAEARLTVKKVVPVTGIELYAPGYDLNIGESAKIDCSLIPADATADLLTWQSSDESILKVNNQGIVTGVGYGTATVTAVANSGVTRTIDITVGEGTINQDFTQGPGKWYLGQSGSQYTYDENGLVITMQSGSKWRGDFCWGSSTNPTTVNVGTYRYLAFKMTRPGAYAINSNTNGTIVLDTSKGRYQQKSGNGNNRYSILGYEGHEADASMNDPQVIYFDLQEGFGNTPYYFSTTATEGSLTTFKLLVADIPASFSQQYTMYWVHTFKTLDELKAYSAKH